MAKLSKVDAAKAAGVSRQTLYTYLKDGRLSADADGLIDTAELLRAGFTLHTGHAIGRQDVMSTRHELTSTPAPLTSSVSNLDVYQDMIAMLKQQLSEAQAREQAALERERSAREREALLLQMLQDMQQRYDHLLDMPRTPPPQSPQDAPEPAQVRRRPESAPPPHRPTQGQPEPQRGDTRGEMRRRIVALLQDHPAGLTTGEMRNLLGVERSLADTVLGMLRYGLVQRVGRGRYVVGERARPD